MLGSIPDFSRGAVVAVFMLIPSIFSILLLKFLERYNFRYNRISTIDMPENRKRDICFGSVSTIIMLIIVSIFVVIFFIPFIKSWPYDLSFSLDTIKATIQDGGLFDVYTNSLFVALLTAIIGTICAYCAGLINARSSLRKSDKSAIDALVQMTNTIPGMVLGIAFLMCFSGTTLQCTYAIIIICNILHYFSSPYLMIKNALSKMNASWETTGMLMGDTWIKTVFRVVIPNSASTIFEMLSYYFINSMVTISAVVFLVGARTMVITTKIQQLQHFGYFEQIFVLSLVIFVTNLVVKGVLSLFAKRAERKGNPC